MAGASKCHLHIPHKDVLAELKDVIPRADASKMAQNFRAIEDWAGRWERGECGAGESCGCKTFIAAGTQFVGGATSIVLSASTNNALQIDWNLGIVVNESGWTTAAGFVSHDDCGIFLAGGSASLTHASGASVVAMRLDGNGLGQSTYPPSPFNVTLEESFMTQTTATGTDFGMLVSIDSPTAATRAFDLVLAVCWGTIICGCPCGVDPG